MKLHIEVRKYNSKIEQLEVGKSGKVGILDIELKGNDQITKLSLQNNFLKFLYKFKEPYILKVHFQAWHICILFHHQEEFYKEIDTRQILF